MGVRLYAIYTFEVKYSVTTHNSYNKSTINRNEMELRHVKRDMVFERLHLNETSFLFKIDTTLESF